MKQKKENEAEFIEAVRDAIFMLKDVKRARELPPYAAVQLQYIALGNKLEQLLKEYEK